MMTSWQDEPDLLNEVREVQVLARTSRRRSIQVAYVCVYQVSYCCLHCGAKAQRVANASGDMRVRDPKLDAVVVRRPFSGTLNR